MEQIVFLGGNGHAIELYEYMSREGIVPVGYYAPHEDTLSKWVKYLGSEEEKFNSEYLYVVASGLISIRKRMIKFIESNHLKTYTYISKYAYVSSIAVIGEGTQVLPYAIISGNPVIGKYVLSGVHSLISHQAVVGNNVVLSPGVKISGNCCIGNNIMFGINAALVPGSVVNDDSEIGIGTVPKKYVKANQFVIAPKSKVCDIELVKTKILNGN